MENEVPADCILMNINIQFVPSNDSFCFYSIFFFIKQGRAKPKQGLAVGAGKQWSEVKQTESIGLKNKMSFSIAAMPTFVSHNHTASRYVIKDVDGGPDHFLELLGKSLKKTFIVVKQCV